MVQTTLNVLQLTDFGDATEDEERSDLEESWAQILLLSNLTIDGIEVTNYYNLFN